MKIEVLYFDGCPNCGTVLDELREQLAKEPVVPDIELLRVESQEHAEQERFLGSPTVRVDGEDVEPGAHERCDFGLKCRLYPSDDGLVGAPPTAWIAAALLRARQSEPE
ncbi:MAG: hypothetical protein AB7V58_10290 [Solirubrobacterales bacterium]